MRSKKLLLERESLNTYLHYSLALIFVLLVVPSSFYHEPKEGLDNSWGISLHLAHKYNLIFGKDFIFTYGPLGILSSRLPITTGLFVYLVFDIYLFATLFSFLKNLFRKHFSVALLMFVFLSCLTVMSQSMEVWFFYFYLFYLFTFLKQPHKKWCLIHSGVLALVCFYYKVNLGVVALFIFLTTIAYAFIRRKINWKVSLVILASMLFAIWLSAYLLHTDLKGYLTTSLKLIDGYNDAMVRPLTTNHLIFVFLALFIVMVIGVWICYAIFFSARNKYFRENSDTFFIYAIIVLCVYVYFKSTFIRGSTHFHVFFSGVTFMVSFFYLFPPEKFRRIFVAYFSWIVVLAAFLAMNLIPGTARPFWNVVTLSIIPAKVNGIKNYIRELIHYNQAVRAADQLAPRQLKLKQFFGSSTVDILPVEISKVYFNNLNYNPRPIVQSYTAYNSFLDSLNCSKYMSADAPDYLMFESKSIDNRYHFFDESKTKLAIIRRYKLVGEFENFLVFRKNGVIRGLARSRKDEYRDIRFGEDVVVDKTTGLQYTKFQINYNLAGAVKRMLYRPPVLRIFFTLETGQTLTFRAIKPILEGGVLINKFINNNHDFELMTRTDGLLNSNIIKIRIDADSDHFGFKDNIRMVNSYYSLEGKTAAEYASDSLAAIQLIHKFEPRLINSSNIRPDSIRISLYQVSTHSPIIVIDGWAFRENGTNENSTVNVILKSEEKIYELKTIHTTTQELAEHFRRQDIKTNGFISTVSKSYLPPGSYQVGVLISFKNSDARYASFLPERIEISR